MAERTIEQNNGDSVQIAISIAGEIAITAALSSTDIQDTRFTQPCADDPEAFFLTDEDEIDELLAVDPEARIIRDFDIAKRLCESCSIIQKCLEVAIESPDEPSYRGGADPQKIEWLSKIKSSTLREASIKGHLDALKLEVWGMPTNERPVELPKQLDQIEQTEQPDSEPIVATPDDHLEQASTTILESSPDTETDEYYTAAAKLLGYPEKTPEELPPKVLLSVARQVIRDGHRHTTIAAEHGIKTNVITKHGPYMVKQVKELPEQVAEKLLDIKPPEELLDHDFNSDGYIDAARRILGINSFRDITGFDSNLWLNILRDRDVRRTPEPEIAWKYGITHAAVTSRLTQIRRVLNELSPEVINHIYGRDMSACA